MACHTEGRRSYFRNRAGHALTGQYLGRPLISLSRVHSRTLGYSEMGHPFLEFGCQVISPLAHAAGCLRPAFTRPARGTSHDQRLILNPDGGPGAETARLQQFLGREQAEPVADPSDLRPRAGKTPNRPAAGDRLFRSPGTRKEILVIRRAWI